MYLVKSLSPDKGSGWYTMYLSLSPYRFLGVKGTDAWCIYRTPCPERGTLPDTWAIPKHTFGHSKTSGRWQAIHRCSHQSDAAPEVSRRAPKTCNSQGVGFLEHPWKTLAERRGGNSSCNRCDAPKFATHPSQVPRPGEGAPLALCKVIPPHHDRLVGYSPPLKGQSLNTHRGNHRSGGAQDKLGLSVGQSRGCPKGNPGKKDMFTPRSLIIT